MVLLDVKRYQDMIDTISLLKLLSFGEEDMKNNAFSTTEELDVQIEDILNA
jgi:hypothetical protein